MFSMDMLQDTLSRALKGSGDFADVYIEGSRVESISLEENKIEQISSGIDIGAGIRILNKDRTIYGYTNDITAKGLYTLASRLSNGNIDSNFKQDIIDTHTVFTSKIKLRPVEDKIRLVNLANRIARELDTRIVQVCVSCSDNVKEFLISNTLRIYETETRFYNSFLISVIAMDNGIIQTGTEIKAGLDIAGSFNETLIEEMSRKAASRALRMLEAKTAPAGTMSVVLSSEAGGTMIHEAIGHSIEADLVQKGLSQYSGMIGEKVASDIITVIDDATIEHKSGSYNIDDEGTPSQRTVLIEKGILKNYLYDILSARKDGKPSTGNGRRQSYHFKPVPRMSNTYIAAGESNPEDIVKSIQNGLFVKKMGGGEVNTVNGDFVFEVREGYEIKNGKICVLVRGATLMGNGPDILKKIDMVGNDLGFEVGTCGKDGQGVPVSDGQPTLRIPEIIVGGK